MSIGFLLFFQNILAKIDFLRVKGDRFALHIVEDRACIVLETQLIRTKRLTVFARFPVGAVFRIFAVTDKRMSDACHMSVDLMRSARDKLDLKERFLASRADDLVFRDDMLPFLARFFALWQDFGDFDLIACAILMQIALKGRFFLRRDTVNTAKIEL